MNRHQRPNALVIRLVFYIFLLSSFDHLFTPGWAQSQPLPEQTGAQEVSFRCGTATLRGFLYKPEGKGPFPSVLWNHGSEKLPGSKPELGPVFSSKGYVFFIPHRSGQGRSPGSYMKDLLDLWDGEVHGHAARSALMVRLYEQHMDDVLAALSYLRSLPYVDQSRIAMAGHSSGGIQTILALERHPDIRAAINFAGAAQNWRKSPHLQQRMLEAVRKTRVPVLFIQASNDYDLTPSRTLDGELERLKKPHRLLIFPASGLDAQEGHEFAMRRVSDWAPSVFSFLNETLSK